MCIVSVESFGNSLLLQTGGGHVIWRCWALQTFMLPHELCRFLSTFCTGQPPLFSMIFVVILRQFLIDSSTCWHCSHFSHPEMVTVIYAAHQSMVILGMCVQCVCLHAKRKSSRTDCYMDQSLTDTGHDRYIYTDTLRLVNINNSVKAVFFYTYTYGYRYGQKKTQPNAAQTSLFIITSLADLQGGLTPPLGEPTKVFSSSTNENVNRISVVESVLFHTGTTVNSILPASVHALS